MGKIRDMVMISERPAEAEDRAVPGHWEGDLTMGKGFTAVGTLVERKTRYLMLRRLPEGHGAEAFRDALTKRIVTLPAQLRRSPEVGSGAKRCREAPLGTLGVYPLVRMTSIRSSNGPGTR